MAQEPVQQKQLRGIFMNPGDTATTAIMPVGDVDTFVFDVLADSVLEVEVRAIKDSLLAPGLELLAPDGTPIDISAKLSERKKKVRIRKLTLLETGRYGLRVAGRNESEGDYRLKLAVTPPKQRTEKFTLSPLKLANVRFGAKPDTIVNVTVKSKGGPVYVVHVADPLGNEIPGANRLFKETDHGLQARLFPTRNSGNYYLGLRGNLDTTTNVTVKIRTKHTPPIAQKRVISKYEPIIDALVPDNGREGNGITIEGRNFLPGTITVLFGEDEAPSAFYVNAGKINVIVPAEGDDSIVDITVYNPDGQSGTKEEAFIFIPPPPVMDSIFPTEGPDAGGTVVQVTGDFMTFVEKVTMDQTPLTTVPIARSPKILEFETDPHPAGTVTVALTDRWGQTAFMSAAFTFALAPDIIALSPTAGTVKGGTSLTLTGAGFRTDDRVYVDGVEITEFTVLSSAQLVLITPPHPLGAVDVKVVDPWDREAVATGAFEYVSGTLVDISNRMPANTASSPMTGVAIAIGDVDKGGIAGRVDIVLGGKSGGQPTRLLLNNGASGFTLSAEKFDTDNSFDVELGDLDGDTDLDLVVTQPVVSVNSYRYNWYVYPSLYYHNEPYVAARVFENDGKGSFTVSQYALPSNLEWASGKPAVTDLLTGESISLGDVDGDKDLDLVITGKSAPTVSTFTRTNPYSWAYHYYFTYYVDGDTSSTRLLTNDGKGTFKNVSGKQMPAVSGDVFAGDDVLVVDVDGDGDKDIVVTGDGANLRDASKPEFTNGSKTRILLNDGTGTFTDGTSTLMPEPTIEDDWGGLGVGVGDLDGDKAVEIIITTDREITTAAGDYVSSTRVFEKGTSAFADATTKFMPAVNTDGTGDSFKAVSVAVGDPDGNGIDEIFLILDSEVYGQDPVSGSWDKQVSSLRWIGRKAALPLTDLTPGQMPVPEATGDYYLGHVVKIGDLDGDGDLDMVITTTLSSYSGDGDRPTRVFEFR
ncbi:MAG: IPT/TIG domain-containing protein [Planctomycetota bacterium]